MASPAFERFRFSFFEDPDSPRNGLDMKALAAHQGQRLLVVGGHSREEKLFMLADGFGLGGFDPRKV